MRWRNSVAAALAMALSACGGSGSDEGQTAVTVPETGTPSPAPAPTPSPTPTPPSSPAPAPSPNLTAAPVTISQPVTPESARYKPIAAAKPKVGISLPIGKCLNYAGQLDAVEYHDWARPVVDTDFAEMVAQGFKTLRVPVNFHRFAGYTKPYTINPDFMARVKHVVDTARAAGLNVIIDNHVNPGMFKYTEAEKPRFLAIWRQISKAFKSQPSNVYFELLNEPQKPIYNKHLPGLFAPVIAAIREDNPTRPIIIGSDRTGMYSLQSFELPDDPYVVPTFHYYEPFKFTHQGAWFVTPLMPTGVSWGSSADYANLNADLAATKAYMERTGRVPFVGEYGVYPDVPRALRIKYMDAVTHAFASIGVQSCIWGYANDFPIRDKNGFFADFMAVLGTTTTLR